ncbi:hypothetical protein SAMN05660209_03664 [Geodermatophilus africanus]|uniref:Uncharacterized protein n=1 Tax=Geodermatophilus africanus TaxID=1137993 RepID=A0A1H3MK03_9ACTN|nr:hypothetical protein [Geodermatophilus africanus]SDY77011.1 hypothetical protein SAMN05660209_03664 [Geodermatophilus africanus]
MTLLVGQGLLDVLSSGMYAGVAGLARHLDTAGLVASLLTLALGPVALWRRTPYLRRALLAAFGAQLGVAALWTVAWVLPFGDGWVESAATAGAGLLFFAVAPTAGLLLTTGEPARRWFSPTGPDAGPDGIAGVPALHPADVPPPRPAVAACVLAGSLAGLSVAGGFFTAMATMSFAALDDQLYEQSGVVALWELASAVPLVIGAVLLFHGLDRRVLIGAAAVVVGISGWWVWVGAFGGLVSGMLFFVLALLFAGPAVTAAVLALQPSVGRFLDARRGTFPPG